MPHRAFTLVELLVVIAIVAILASLLLPALAQAKSKALAVKCVGNFQQMQVAWQLYLTDHDDWLVPNNPYWTRDASPQYLPTWAGGNAEYGQPEGNNDALLLGGDPTQPKVGLLGPYLKTARIFRCPADHSTTLLGDGRRHPRNRSCAMNGYMGTLAIVEGLNPSGVYPHVLKLGDVVLLQRPEVLVWSDIHEDYLRSCAMSIANTGFDQSFGDAPGTRHSRGAAVSFVDGHVELHRWVEPLTLQPVTGEAKSGFVSGPNRDYLWLRTRMTRGKRDQW